VPSLSRVVTTSDAYFMESVFPLLKPENDHGDKVTPTPTAPAPDTSQPPGIPQVSDHYDETPDEILETVGYANLARALGEDDRTPSLAAAYEAATRGAAITRESRRVLILFSGPYTDALTASPPSYSNAASKLTRLTATPSTGGGETIAYSTTLSSPASTTAYVLENTLPSFRPLRAVPTPSPGTSPTTPATADLPRSALGPTSSAYLMCQASTSASSQTSQRDHPPHLRLTLSGTPSWR
jgi:hypothetical protein